jgi:hypothetical protein
LRLAAVIQRTIKAITRIIAIIQSSRWNTKFRISPSTIRIIIPMQQMGPPPAEELLLEDENDPLPPLEKPPPPNEPLLEPPSHQMIKFSAIKTNKYHFTFYYD